MRSTVSTPGRRLRYVGVAVVIAAIPTIAAVTRQEAAPRTLAACNDVVDTTDSFSMNCAPTMMPDTSDQLTEAEVAMPGYNAVPGGDMHGGSGGGGGGGGGHGGR